MTLENSDGLILLYELCFVMSELQEFEYQSPATPLLKRSKTAVKQIFCSFLAVERVNRDGLSSESKTAIRA